VRRAGGPWRSHASGGRPRQAGLPRDGRGDRSTLRQPSRRVRPGTPRRPPNPGAGRRGPPPRRQSVGRDGVARPRRPPRTSR
jgi:hypothetical protein